MTPEKRAEIKEILHFVKRDRIDTELAMKQIEQILDRKVKCEFFGHCRLWVVGLKCQSSCVSKMNEYEKMRSE